MNQEYINKSAEEIMTILLVDSGCSNDLVQPHSLLVGLAEELGSEMRQPVVSNGCTDDTEMFIETCMKVLKHI